MFCHLTMLIETLSSDQKPFGSTIQRTVYIITEYYFTFQHIYFI